MEPRFLDSWLGKCILRCRLKRQDTEEVELSTVSLLQRSGSAGGSTGIGRIAKRQPCLVDYTLVIASSYFSSKPLLVDNTCFGDSNPPLSHHRTSNVTVALPLLSYLQSLPGLDHVRPGPQQGTGTAA